MELNIAIDAGQQSEQLVVKEENERMTPWNNERRQKSKSIRKGCIKK